MNRSLFSLSLVTLASVVALAASAAAQQETPKIKIPEPGVPQIMTLEGRYVRAAYNNEGYAILGYSVANLSVGEEWLLLDIGLTVRDGVPSFELKREALSLETPDGKTLPLPSVADYRSANLSALNTRARVQRDSINYFPPSAHQACRIGFFSDVNQVAMSWDQVELSSQRACVGRIFFQVPGGIQYGQHWLNIKFEKGLVRVPFRILTKDEAKLLDKNYKSIEKQVEEAFSKKKS
jgi:hypothetical protein